MKLRMRELVAVALVALGFYMLIGPANLAYAAETILEGSGSSDGITGKQLATGLYCDGRALLTGPFGLMLGLLMVFMGLWKLINGAGWFAAITSIIIGAAIPSIPGLVEGFMQGYGTLLKESGMLGENSQPLDIASLGCSSGSSGIPESATAADSGPDLVRRQQWQTPNNAPLSGGLNFGGPR
jgi:hypothetical protein